jgi:hypothetical protein
MRRLLALAVGGLGLGAFLRRRRAKPPAPEESHASELREKLAEARAAEVEQPPEPPADELDGRRRDIHERTRRSIDELS